MDPHLPALTAKEAAVARRVQAWGTAALVAAAVAAGAAALGLALVAPQAILAVPLGVAALVGVAAAARHPLGGVTAAILLSLGLGGLANDYPAGKFVFGAYLVLFVAAWYARALSAGERIVVSRTDVGMAFLLVFGVGGGAVLGLAFGNPVADIIGNVQALLPLFLYFPVKAACARETRGPIVVAGCVLVLGVAAAVQNAFTTRQALSSATEVWQIVDVRVAYGEITLCASVLLCLALLFATRGSWPARGALIGLFGVLMGGLILTKSRGFWVATLLGIAVFALVLRPADRRRLVGVATAGGVAFVGLAVLVAGRYALLIATGIAKRFMTLGTASTADVSLLNRFAESAGVWAQIKANPILGHGWGAQYAYYSLISEGTRTWAYVHNGFLGVWHKIGLWGLVLVLWVWAGAVVGGIAAARARQLSPTNRGLAGAAAAALVALGLVANSSPPLENADQAIVLLVLWALAQGIAQRSRAGGADLAARPAETLAETPQRA